MEGNFVYKLGENWKPLFGRVFTMTHPGRLATSCYDGPPLPTLVVAFKEGNAVIACFDEESQYMLEGTSEPAMCVVFSPHKPKEVQHAVRVVGRFIAINCEVCRLVEELKDWEKRHAG